MTESMSHRERVLACLAGEDADRPPVSMWRHFYAEETAAGTLAEAMLGFQREYDWDFMKVNPRASYHAEDWGLEMRTGGDGSPEPVSWPVSEPGDWTRLPVLDPHAGVLGEQLEALRLIGDGLEGEVPFLMTVFTPLSIAARLVPSEDAFLRHLREHPDEVRHALDVVTETFVRYTNACLDAGASGLFYATTSWATTDSLTLDEYAGYARPYDLRVLEAASEAEFNLLHVCRDNNMLAELGDYPVHAFNWDAHGQGNLSLAEGRATLAPKAVVGGLPHKSGLVDAEPADLARAVQDTSNAMGAAGWMLGTGCTFPPNTPAANVRAVSIAARGN